MDIFNHLEYWKYFNLQCLFLWLDILMFLWVVLIIGSEEKLNEIRIVFIHGDQLNYLPNLRKLNTMHNWIYLQFSVWFEVTEESLGLPVEYVVLFSVFRVTFKHNWFGQTTYNFKLTCMLEMCLNKGKSFWNEKKKKTKQTNLLPFFFTYISFLLFVVFRFL